MTVGGREFTFIRGTPEFVLLMDRKRWESRITGEKIAESVGSPEALKAFSKEWTEFCSDIFVHDWRWRIFGFPRELKYENLDLVSGELSEIIAGFFGLQEAIVTAPLKQRVSSSNS